MRVFAYSRVSNRDQVDGYSLEAQERAIRAHCRAHGWDEPVWFVDAGRSGYTDVTDKRPSFARRLGEATSWTGLRARS
jgi:DNA invertase Pin-like site-specific DNA recombinase